MKKNKYNRIKATIPTASMADVAFLLIVFFLITTSLTKDKGIGFTLPAPDSAIRIPRRNITNVRINSEGIITHDEVKVTPDQLGNRIRIMTENNPDMHVSIMTDPDALYEWFIEATDEIMKSGNVKISIADPEF
ncbi:ExbD/TolR family protein [Candidatus Latescibacterota bacterium]